MKFPFLQLLVFTTLLSPWEPLYAQVRPSFKSHSEVADLSEMTREVMALTNKYRIEKGLSVLVWDNDLAGMAGHHAVSMATKALPFGHSGFDKRAAGYRKKQQAFVSGFAENVAMGSRDAAEVMQGWIESPAHRRNIEGSFTHIGVGIAADKDGVLYFTQLFALQDSYSNP